MVCLVFTVGIEARGAACYVESVRAVEVSRAKRNGGGVLDLDMQMRWRRENAVGRRRVCQSIPIKISSVIASSPEVK